VTSPVLAPGLRPVRITLPNGAVVIVKETHKTPAVSFQISLRAGSICDPADGLGAMHLLSRVIDRGTRTRSADAIAADLDDRGVSLSIGVSRHLLSISCTSLAEDFGEILAVLGDIVMAPAVPESELEIRRGEVITSLRQDDDSPAVRAMETLMEQLYGSGHPYGRRARGTIDSVERLTRQQLLDLHAAYCGPSVLSVVIVGEVDAQRAMAEAERVFGGWRNDVAAPMVVPSPVPFSTRRRTVVPMMNKAQTDIAYGFTTISRLDPDYFPLRLLSNVFGEYAMGGRLGDNIRERQGMAYYASAVFDPNVVAGPLVVRAGVSAANVERTITAIDDEVAQIAREGVTEREQQESTDYLIGSLPRQLETNAGIAQFLQTAEFFRLGLDYDVRLPESLRGVTNEAIRDVAARYLDTARATVVIAGPYRDAV
jgi:zinc protease